MALPPLTLSLVFLPGEFMESLQDPDLNVRRATLAFFNSAVHNKPSLVRDLLDDILPLLYQETKIHRDLIREVSWERLGLTAGTGARIRGRLIRAGTGPMVKVSCRCDPGQGNQILCEP